MAGWCERGGEHSVLGRVHDWLGTPEDPRWRGALPPNGRWLLLHLMLAGAAACSLPLALAWRRGGALQGRFECKLMECPCLPRALGLQVQWPPTALKVVDPSKRSGRMLIPVLGRAGAGASVATPLDPGTHSILCAPGQGRVVLGRSILRSCLRLANVAVGTLCMRRCQGHRGNRSSTLLSLSSLSAGHATSHTTPDRQTTHHTIMDTHH